MKKLRASDKVTVKYSREGLTERNLSEKTETVVSNKRADISFGKRRGSEFDIRSHNADNVQASRKSPKSVTAFNVMSDKGIKERLLNTDSSTLDSNEPLYIHTYSNTAEKANTTRSIADFSVKDIKPELHTSYTVKHTAKKEHIRQQPKRGSNFKPKRQRIKIPKPEKTLNPSPVSKFIEDKKSLKFDVTDDQKALKFEKSDVPHTDDPNTPDDAPSTGNDVKQTLKFGRTIAYQTVKATQGTLKQNRRRLRFKKSQQTSSQDIRSAMEKLLSEKPGVTKKGDADFTKEPQQDLNLKVEKRDVNLKSDIKSDFNFVKDAKQDRNNKSNRQSEKASTPKRSSLMFKPEEKPLSTGTEDGHKSSDSIPSDNDNSKKPRSYIKAEKKADKAMSKLEKAESKQPTHKVLKHERVYDDKKGKARHRLYFEEEKKPPRKQYISKELPKAAVSAAALEVKSKVHQKLYHAENDNSAVKAAHRTELIAEHSSNAAFRYAVKRHRDKPYRLQRKVDRLKYKAEKANRRLLFEKTVHENPQLNRSIRKRTQYKQFIKQKYKQQMRSYAQKKSAKKVAQKTASVIKEFITVKNKGCLVLVLIAVLMALVLCSLFAVTLTSMTGSIVNEYTSSDEEIGNVASAWQALEDDLQNEIDNIETEYPGYDRYVYDLDTIGVDKQKILAYFSAKYKKIVYADHSADIESFFNELYVYSLVSYTDGDYSELQIELQVNDLDALIERNLTDEEKQAYGAYLEIFQNSEDYNEIIENAER